MWTGHIPDNFEIKAIFFIGLQPKLRPLGNRSRPSRKIAARTFRERSQRAPRSFLTDLIVRRGNDIFCKSGGEDSRTINIGVQLPGRR